MLLQDELLQIRSDVPWYCGAMAKMVWYMVRGARSGSGHVALKCGVRGNADVGMWACGHSALPPSFNSVTKLWAGKPDAAFKHGERTSEFC